MRRPPTPRRDIFDLYWYYASERQAIFERRIAGLPPPWSIDPILQSYKFCNVYRASDRVSQFLIRDIVYSDLPNRPEDRVFQIVAFRLFSKIDTWKGVCCFLGRAPIIGDLQNGSFRAALEHTKQENGGLYTGAFILCANNAFGQGMKHLNHLELLRNMFVEGDLALRVLESTSLEVVYHDLHAYPLMGDFMSYQIAVDLNYSAFVNFSENDFTKPGPGALRGIQKVFQHLGDYSAEEVIFWMVERQVQEFKRLNLPFYGLYGRPLHAIDCQGLFCELDKYCREAVPELKSARRRIKARFSQSSKPVVLFFPPKWGLNGQLPKHPVLGEAESGKALQPALF